MHRKKLTLIVLLLAALLPYIALCFYALPFADDFCYAWSSGEHVTFAHKFMKQYMHWSGRYSAHLLLCNHPFATGSIAAYQQAVLAVFITTVIAVALFVYSIMRNAFNAAVTAFFILLFYLCYIPQLAEGIYWYTGVCNYLLSNNCMLLHLTCMVLWAQTKKWWLLIPAALFIIAAIGFTEVGAALIPAYYLLAVIVLYKDGAHNERKLFGITVLFFAVAFLAAAALAFAPGNHTRSSSKEFHGQYMLLHSVFYGSLQVVRFTGKWLCTAPALMLSGIVVAYSGRISSSAIPRLPHWLILFLLLFTVFAGAFLPYYTTGILGQHRTINYVFYYFIFFWLWWLVLVSREYVLYQRKLFVFMRSNSFALAIACIIIMAFTGNGGNIMRDAAHGNFTAYRHNFIQRQTNIIAHPLQPVPPLQHVPQSFLIVDARTDTTYWVNKCIRYSYINNVVKK